MQEREGQSEKERIIKWELVNNKKKTWSFPKIEGLVGLKCITNGKVIQGIQGAINQRFWFLGPRQNML